jgi:NADH-quinone oxidoreductase subunit C
MTPEELSPEELGTVEVAFGTTTVDVAPAEWVPAHRKARDNGGLTFFDWLSGYDDGDAGLAVVSSLWSVPGRRGLLLRTRIPREEPRLASLTEVFRGANWHERETFEMFGVIFEGHPLLIPLLLPDGFEGHPLRKEFVLASRVAKSWPGAKEPGESDADTAGHPTRRKMAAPGVPDPDQWGGDWR